MLVNSPAGRFLQMTAATKHSYNLTASASPLGTSQTPQGFVISVYCRMEGVKEKYKEKKKKSDDNEISTGSKK